MGVDVLRLRQLRQIGKILQMKSGLIQIRGETAVKNGIAVSNAGGGVLGVVDQKSGFGVDVAEVQTHVAQIVLLKSAELVGRILQNPSVCLGNSDESIFERFVEFLYFIVFPFCWHTRHGQGFLAPFENSPHTHDDGTWCRFEDRSIDFWMETSIAN